MIAKIQSSLPLLLGTLAALSVFVSSLINWFQAYPKVETVLHKIADVLSLIPQTGMKGPGDLPIKLPLMRTKRVDIVGSPLPVVLPLLFISALSGCAATKQVVANFGKCEVGQLPAASQALISDVTAILLTNADWMQQLQVLTAQVGVPTLNCAVQAVMARLSTQVPKGQMADVYMVAIKRGHAWVYGAVL